MESTLESIRNSNGILALAYWEHNLRTHLWSIPAPLGECLAKVGLEGTGHRATSRRPRPRLNMRRSASSPFRP